MCLTGVKQFLVLVCIWYLFKGKHVLKIKYQREKDKEDEQTLETNT